MNEEITTAESLPEGELKPERILGVLRGLMETSGSDSTRVQACKLLLDRLVPEKNDNDDEEQKRAAEQTGALAEARQLLDDLVDQIHKANNLPRKMAETGEAEPDNAAR